MKALGVDLGTRRIGLAISAGGLALAHGTIERGDDPHAARAAIVAAARSEGCDVIVVGVARSLSGERGPAARAAEEDLAALATLAPDLHVVGHDERLTTVIAARELRAAGMSERRARTRVDETAAAVILQSYLDASAS